MSIELALAIAATQGWLLTHSTENVRVPLFGKNENVIDEEKDPLDWRDDEPYNPEK